MVTIDPGYNLGPHRLCFLSQDCHKPVTGFIIPSGYIDVRQSDARGGYFFSRYILHLRAERAG
jgi:hypothetical protein